MPYNFTATTDYFEAQKNVTTLIKFAENQSEIGKEKNRALFLKLGVVLLVTRFQVFVESVLKEFDFNIKRTGKLNSDIPLHFRLNSIRINTDRRKIQDELRDPNQYNPQKFSSILEIVNMLYDWCDDVNPIHPEFRMETKFPLGQTGLNDLKKLFRQIEGKDIFESARFDINKLNEILNRRHVIIHEDGNQQITEVTLKEYKKFMETVVKFIDRYLKRVS